MLANNYTSKLYERERECELKKLVLADTNMVFGHLVKADHITIKQYDSTI